MRQMKRKNGRTTGFKWLLGAIAAGFMGVATPVHAEDLFGNEAVQFPVDTTIEFEFKESHGAYRSTLGVVNLDTGEETVLFQEVKPYDGFGSEQPQPSSPGQNNIGTAIDFLGTVDGGAVQNRLSEYTFKANTRYAFYLESVSPTGQTRRSVRSTTNLAAAFNGSLDGGTNEEITGVRIAWDDTGLPQPGKDEDFDDFVIEAGGFPPVPCPPIR
ncbi:hypothetical protein NDA03_17480 [Trichocoleus sp. Lan]|uniref:hypothetical protein n=1 Tax=Trichocoleus sp. Lan TaxID=2933927 RepID=UPI0032993780